MISGALYFADRRMKTDDNHFRGFPALWNAAAFYLFLLRPPPALASLIGRGAYRADIRSLPCDTSGPRRAAARSHFVADCAWAVLAIMTVVNDFDVGAPVIAGLCAIAVYMVGSDAAIRLIRTFKA